MGPSSQARNWRRSEAHAAAGNQEGEPSIIYQETAGLSVVIGRDAPGLGTMKILCRRLLAAAR
jgi:hypothetical protein